MTTEGLGGGELLVGDVAGTATAPSAASIVNHCDRLLGEVGRRQHRFGWLRVPDADAEQWLPVDAYYPSNRLVVLCREPPTLHDARYQELITAHGLRLLLVAPNELRAEPEGAFAALERRIAELEPVTRSSGQLAPVRQSRGSPVLFALASMVRPANQSGPAGRRAAPEPRYSDRFVAAGLMVGVVLIALLGAEMYIAISQVALGAGHVALAFAIVLDACARVLGTIGAQRAGQPGWVWPCVIGGSPVVSAFALFQRSGPVSAEPAPLAGLVSLVALGVAAIALLTTALGL